MKKRRYYNNRIVLESQGNIEVEFLMKLRDVLETLRLGYVFDFSSSPKGRLKGELWFDYDSIKEFKEKFNKWVCLE